MNRNCFENNARAALAALFVMAATPAAAENAGGYVDLAATETAVPETEVAACTADGWLVTMYYEIVTSGGPVSPDDLSGLDRTLEEALRENIQTRNHENVSITPGGAFRADVISRVDPLASASDARNQGRVHIGLDDGKYVDFCPVS